MVLFNHSTRELTAKIVYYGPGLCGKTTNLRLLHEKLDQATTGRLLSLSTAQDRTIYFDLLPVELGNVKGYTVRFQLCTVPGQVFYNETRKLVLKGADGIVFVVDSQWSMLSHNLESFQNLRENMAELGQNLDEAAVVIQYNKRDLPGVLSVQALQESLGFQEFPFVESIAADAKGVVETFKLVSKLTFIHILKRLQRSPDGERLGPDWVAPSPPNSQSTVRIPPVSAQLLALTSHRRPRPGTSDRIALRDDRLLARPRERRGLWRDDDSSLPDRAAGRAPRRAGRRARGRVECRAPGRAGRGARTEASAPLDADDTFTEAPPAPGTEPEPEPEPLPEMVLGPVPASQNRSRNRNRNRARTGAGPNRNRSRSRPAPEPGGIDSQREAGLEPSSIPERHRAWPRAEAAPVPEPPPPPPAPEPPPPPPAAAVWAEAFAGISSRLDEMARVHAEESARVEALARETREAVETVSVTVKEALGALAPAAAVTALREALEGRVDELRTSLEQRHASLEAAIAKLEASDRLEEVRRETLEMMRLVEARLDEAGGQSRRLSGILRRALEELDPPGKG